MRKNVLLLVVTLTTIVLSMMFAGAATLYGDLNADGSVDSTDVTIMKRVLLKKMTIEDVVAADLDGDGEVNSTDLTLLKRYLLKKITKFPVENVDPTITPTPTQEITPTPTEINEEIFAFKIRTDSKGEIYQFPIESGEENYNIIVDWGDETTSMITDFSTRGHKYEKAGTYTIKVLSFDYMPISFSDDTRLIEVLMPLPDIKATSFKYSFYGCTNLTEIPEALFANNINATSFQYCFYGCSNLTQIPDGLFANNINATSFVFCFYGCSNLTGLAPTLWLRTNVIYYGSCYYGCTELSNYKDIPYDWKFR